MLEEAYQWVSAKRSERNHNNRLWDLRAKWSTVKPQLLRKMIQLTHNILKKLKLKMHPDKTFLGCIKKGFDFLGVHFGDEPRISKSSLENHRSKLAQRYAQGASAACIGHYIARWASWCAGVLKCCGSQFTVINSMGQEDSRQLGLVNLPKENNHEENYVSQPAEEPRVMISVLSEYQSLLPNTLHSVLFEILPLIT